MARMRAIVAIGVVVGLALLGLLPQLRRVRAVLGFEHFIATGHLYLVIGGVLGPAGLGLVDDALLADLAPVFVFLLSWMGLIVGLRMELGLLGRVGSLGIGLTGIAAALPAMLVPPFVASVPGLQESPSTLLVAGGCAGGTAATAATYLLRGRQSSELSFVSVAAALDDWVIVLLALVGFALARGLSLDAGAFVGASLLAAGVTGAVVALLIPRLQQAGEELVVTIGAAALAGGVAAYLGLSTVVAGAVTGLVAANVAPRQRGTRDLYDLVTRVERPLYHAFVVLAGAVVSLRRPELWVPVTVAFMGARFLGKLVGGWVGTRLAGELTRAGRVAAAMLPMSPLALAVAVDLRLVHPTDFTEALLTAVAVSWLLFEGAAAVIAPRVLRSREAAS